MQIGPKGIENPSVTSIIHDYDIEKETTFKRHKSKKPPLHNLLYDPQHSIWNHQLRKPYKRSPLYQL